MQVKTVTGPVRPEDLGATLMHEHVGAVALPGLYSGGRSDDTEQLAISALRCLPEYGVGTVVDLTGRSRVGDRHSDDLLRSVSERASLNIVAGFSFYKDPWASRAGGEDVDSLANVFVEFDDDEQTGCGIYGEVGTSLDRVTPSEEMQLRAAARAHLVTNLAIYTHCTLGTMALEQATILAEEGVDMSRVVLGHLDLKPEIDHLEDVLATGANLGFDTFGKEWFDYRIPGSEAEGSGEFVKRAYHRSDSDRIEALAELCSRGHEERIVLSTDMSGGEAFLNPSTHGRYGYSYIHEVVCPRLRELGVGEDSLRRMLVDNPARILAVP